jgi:hypothetical protein
MTEIPRYTSFQSRCAGGTVKPDRRGAAMTAERTPPLHIVFAVYPG